MSQYSPKADARAASVLQEIYRPILRGYFGVFALYYAAMFPTHLVYFTGLERIQMGSLSSIAAIIGLYGVRTLRKPTDADRTAAILLAMNIIVVCNVIAALNINLLPEKLTYFIMMVMVFGLASVNLRHSLLSIALAMLAMFSFFPEVQPGTYFVFTFLTFAAALASLFIAIYMRRSIMNIAHAKIEAEGQLEEARLISGELRQKSLSDSLTQLPNRRAFFGALQQTRRRLREGDDGSLGPLGHAWLLLVDLDGFKAVNDIHGHMTGDALLQEVAQRLKHCAGSQAHVSRMGGDEFNLILPKPAAENEVRAYCENWLTALSRPYVIDGRHIVISASIGCMKLMAGEASRTQINQADYALMVAKKQGKNRVVVFNDDHALQAEARHEIERALRSADLSREITLVLQPQYDLRSERFVRAEALARWDSPVIGQVEPQRFIRIAEESGLITGITLAVAEKAFASIQSGRTTLPLSVNLSSYDLISDPTIQHIIGMAKTFEIDPQMVEFEVTETAMMADFEKAKANLQRLSETGFTIALDDFGTGYSNFSYLRALPIHKLKVDRTFLENPGDPMTGKMLNSLAGMSRVLGIECLIEGVEDVLDLVIAKRSGVGLIQGYYFGAPMSASDLQAHIEMDRHFASPDAVRA